MGLLDVTNATARNGGQTALVEHRTGVMAKYTSLDTISATLFRVFPRIFHENPMLPLKPRSRARVLFAAVLLASSACSTFGQWHPAGREARLGARLDQGWQQFGTLAIDLAYFALDGGYVQVTRLNGHACAYRTDSGNSWRRRNPS